MQEDIEKRIQDLEKFKKELEASWSIPFKVRQALTDGLSLKGIIKPSSKSSTSENVSINEGGTATKNALGIPDTYIQWTDKNTNITYYIPVFTS